MAVILIPERYSCGVKLLHYANSSVLGRSLPEENDRLTFYEPWLGANDNLSRNSKLREVRNFEISILRRHAPQNNKAWRSAERYIGIHATSPKELIYFVTGT